MKQRIKKESAIIGYKGFDKNLCCCSKQYEVGKEHHEDKVSICNYGMHFVTDPSDLPIYYPPSKGNRYCRVKAWGTVDSAKDDSKHCASDLFVEKELSITELVEEIATYRNAHLKEDPNIITASDTENHTSVINRSERSSSNNTGNCSLAGNTGNYSLASNTGAYSSANNTGGNSIACNIGVCSASSNTGSFSLASNAGRHSSSSNTGNHSSANNSGDYSAAFNTGNYSLATNTGHYSSASNTGDRSSTSNTGDFSSSVAAGYGSAAISMGKDSIAAVFGQDGRAKGTIGCWLVLTERDSNYHILGMQCVKVDGKTIKADTWYRLKDGKVKETVIL